MTRPLSLAMLALAACGSGMAAPDVAAFSQATTDLRAAVAHHRAEAATVAAAGDCPSAMQPYFAAARPISDRMTGMSGAMDDCMGAMGHSADSGVNCRAMGGELDRHGRDGCAGDAAARQREVVRDCDAMDAYLDHAAGVSSQMGGMRGAGGMMSGGTCSR